VRRAAVPRGFPRALVPRGPCPAGCLLPSVVALVLGTACSTSTPLASCDDDLRGAWRDEASGVRWMILDRGASLEVYPLFADAVPAGAPRVIDLARGDGVVAGEVKRRFDHAADVCLARAPVRVTACHGDTLELVLADPVGPLGYAPCTWGTTAPSHRERWRRD